MEGRVPVKTLPLYLHKAESHHVAALKTAKRALDLDVLLQPMEARPGQFGRVLAFREEPTWLCEYLTVTGPEMAEDAILWALGRKEMPTETYAEILTRWMGAEVKEIA